MALQPAALSEGSVLELSPLRRGRGRKQQHTQIIPIVALAPAHEQQIKILTDGVDALKAIIRDQGVHLDQAIKARKAYELDANQKEILNSAIRMFLSAGAICLVTSFVTLVWLPRDSMNWFLVAVVKLGSFVALGIFLLLFGGAVAAQRWFQ